MKQILSFCCFLLFFVSMSQRLHAQASTGDVASPAGFRGEFLTDLKEVEDKYVGLAEAMPDGKYSWRPMKGVRSVSEVFMHIVGANYGFPRAVGVKPPDDVPKNMEKTITKKADVMDWLKKSFAHLRDAMNKTPDDSLSTPTKLFGQPSTYQGVFFTAAVHLHEHLGQSIAYARMNKVVPPWTAAEQQQEAKKK